MLRLEAAEARHPGLGTRHRHYWEQPAGRTARTHPLQTPTREIRRVAADRVRSQDGARQDREHKTDPGGVIMAAEGRRALPQAFRTDQCIGAPYPD